MARATPQDGAFLARITPALFVVLWSTGFIGARLGLPDADALAFLAVRFALVVPILAATAIATGAPWPRHWREVGHYAVAGLLVHAIYLGGVFTAIGLGVEAGVSALIVSLQPLLVAALAGLLLGETVRPWQWIGLALGLLGAGLILLRKISGVGGGGVAGPLLCVMALLGITAGTLYQKRYCARMDLRTGNVIQFAAAAVACAIGASLFQRWRIDWTPAFVFALAWLVLVLSVGAITLLYQLIRRGDASRVSSLFFLVPPCTALIAWPAFGETLGPVELLGMAIAVTGVAMVNWRPRR